MALRGTSTVTQTGGSFTPPATPSGVNRGAATVSVTVGDLNVAPAGVKVEVTATTGLAALDPPESGTYEHYEGDFHQYTPIMWVRNGPLGPWSAPVNKYAPHQDANIQIGQYVWFVFPDPGAYFIDGYVIDKNGDYNTITASVTIADPDNVFPTTQTICVSTAGNFADAPSGAQQVTSIAAMETAIAANTNPKRVLFRYGETHTDFSVTTPSGGRADYFGAFGTPAAGLPVLRPPQFSASNMLTFRSTNSAESDITVCNIRFRGYWNPDKELGFAGGSSMYWRDKSSHFHVTAYNLDISGLDQNITASSNAGSCNICIADCAIYNWQDYGIFGGANFELDDGIAIMGCRITQSPDSMNGGPKGDSLHNRHGPIRLARAGRAYITQNDLFSNNGWSGDNDTQHCLRLQAAGDPSAGTKAIVHRNVMENGYMIVSLEGENESAPNRPGNYRLEANLMIATARARAKGTSSYAGGTTWLNNIYIEPNEPTYSGGSTSVFSFNFSSSDNQDNNLSYPMMVSNNTHIGLLDATNEKTVRSMTDNISAWAITEETANVREIPNGASPVSSHTNIDITSTFPDITPRYKGVTWSYQKPSGSTGTWANDDFFTIPYSSIFIQDFRGEGGSGAAVNQAYMQDVLSSGDNDHRMLLNGSFIHAEAGDFELDADSDASNLRVYNRSGGTLSGTYTLCIDRYHRYDTDGLGQYQYANPATVPTGRPTSGSTALTAGGSDYAILDFDMKNPRTGTKAAGAWQSVA